jgi:beta-lactamase regulating signal transducer with metallopeptidase domain
MKRCLYCKSILNTLQFDKKNSLICRNCLKKNKKEIDKICIIHEDFGIYYYEDKKTCCLL